MTDGVEKVRAKLPDISEYIANEEIRDIGLTAIDTRFAFETDTQPIVMSEESEREVEETRILDIDQIKYRVGKIIDVGSWVKPSLPLWASDINIANFHKIEEISANNPDFLTEMLAKPREQILQPMSSTSALSFGVPLDCAKKLIVSNDPQSIFSLILAGMPCEKALEFDGIEQQYLDYIVEYRTFGGQDDYLFHCQTEGNSQNLSSGKFCDELKAQRDMTDVILSGSHYSNVKDILSVDE